MVALVASLALVLVVATLVLNRSHDKSSS